MDRLAWIISSPPGIHSRRYSSLNAPRSSGWVASGTRYTPARSVCSAPKPSALRGDLAVADGEGERLELRVHPELRQDVLHVRPKGVRGDAQVCRDVVGRHPLCHELKDLRLAGRQSFDPLLLARLLRPAVTEVPQDPPDLVRLHQRLALVGQTD